MTKWKYIVSILVLMGITFAFLLFLYLYRQVDIAGPQDEIQQLELETPERTYTARDIAWIILTGDYKYMWDQKNNKSDEEIIKKACENINIMMDNIENYSIKNSIGNELKQMDECQITTSLFAGELYGELITYNLVSVWAKWGSVTYEEETGLIISLEYYVDRVTGTNTINEEAKKEMSLVYTYMQRAAEKYYENIGVKLVYSELYNIQSDNSNEMNDKVKEIYVIAVMLDSDAYKENNIEQEIHN